MRGMQTCLFLGAGASAEFGYPVTSQILPLIRMGLHKGDLFAFRDDGKMLCARLTGFLMKLFPGFADAAERNLPTIVDLLSLLDHSLRSSTSLVRLTPVHELAELRTLLEVGVCEVIHLKQENIKPAARAFWEWLSSRNTQERDSVALISTNYDTSIEQLMSRNLDFSRIKQSVDFGVSWREPDRAELYRRPAKPWLRLYKLHGSLNWLRCDMCEHMYLNYQWDIHRRVLDSEVMSKNSCHCRHGKLSLMLVTPSYVRDIREPNLIALWQSAQELLRTSDEWVFVGYSLPAEDVNIRSMLIRAAQGRNQPPRVTVVLDPKSIGIFPRFQLLFPTFVKDSRGFGAYISDLSGAQF
jgi:NAD-dependent SIR2 family protein deacetylase